MSNISNVKSKNTQRTLELMVGLFVLLGLASLLFFALKVSKVSLSNQEYYSVDARFDNVGTLKEGASVKSAGVVVGQVNKVSFNNDVYQAIVNMQLNKAYQFPKDSQFKIATTGLLGDQYIALEAGAEKEMLTNTSQAENTQSAMVLEDLIGKLLYSKAKEAGQQTQ